MFSDLKFYEITLGLVVFKAVWTGSQKIKPLTGLWVVLPQS